MSDLTTEQLETIRSLLLDPLRETVKSEIERSHDRLGAAVEKLADRLAGHIERTEKRVVFVEREVTRLRSFRQRVLAIYGVVAFMLSLLWSVIRERIFSR